MYIPKKRALQQGLSVIELLIGVAVGLFILSGALMLFGDYINNNRRLVLETQVNQDIRAAADLIARDLRRAGYWGNATAGVFTNNNISATASSPYAAVSPSGTSASSTTTYSYSQDNTENNTLDNAEKFGFRLNAGVLQYQQGNANWQAITDSNTLKIDKFTVTPTPKPKKMCVQLDQYCTGGSSTCASCTVDPDSGCPTAACATCPFIKVRSYDIALQGTSKTDTTVTRTIQETVRVRNEELLGSCPL
ncbi:MAG: PilW family protein [Acidovorax defluvii]